jgi:hypothetical protein
LRGRADIQPYGTGCSYLRFRSTDVGVADGTIGVHLVPVTAGLLKDTRQHVESVRLNLELLQA